MRHWILSVLIGFLFATGPLLAQSDLPVLRPNFVMTPPMPEERTQFGVSIGVGAELIAVGDMTRGTVYVHDADTGDRRLELMATEPGSPFGDRQLGSDVAVWGDLVLAGARTGQTFIDDGPEFHFGGGFLFDGRTGEQLHHFVVADQDESVVSIPGFSVTLNDKYAVLGDNRGGAFVFDPATGDELHRFTPPSLNGATRAGESDVELSGDLLALGAPTHADANGMIDPAVFVFDLTTGEEVVKISAPEGVFPFGKAIEIAPDRVFVHAGSKISAYGFDGDLINSIDVDIESGNHWTVAYSEGTLAVDVGTTQLLNAETLEPEFTYAERLITSIAMHEDRLVLGSNSIENFAYAYTIPEPTATLSWILLAVFPLFRTSLRERMRLLPVQPPNGNIPVSMDSAFTVVL